MAWKDGRSKPVIGIIGGIGAGKSAIARLFAEEGWAVIDADALAHEIIQTAEVKEQLQNWWGVAILDGGGKVDRKAVGEKVFSNSTELERLNGLIHPKVAERREELMVEYLKDPAVRGVVWDIPLLMEKGLDRACDALVYVSAPVEVRLERLKARRGWGTAELEKREKLQIPLDKKAAVADYCIDNRGDQVASHYQVQRVLSHLFLKSS